MRRPVAIIVAVLGAALLLSACDISINPGPTPRAPDLTVTANADPAAPVRSLTLPSRSDVLVRINVTDAAMAGNSALYIELDTSLDLQVFSAGRSPIASSSSPAFFARGAAGISSAAVDLAPQAIVTTVPCRGSCVILEPSSDTSFFALITNRTGSSRSFDLFVFGDIFTDVYERANNRTDTAPVLPLGASLAESGALEVLDDVDYWYAQTNGTLRFTAPNSSVGVVAVVTDGAGNEISTRFGPESNISMNAGEFLKVISASNRAGPSATSAYYLTAP